MKFLLFRYGLSKSIQTREIVGQLLVQIARLSAFLFAIDCRTLTQATGPEDAEYDLVSPSFLRLLGSVNMKDDDQLANGFVYPNNLGLLDSLHIFQASSADLLGQLNRFTESITANVLQSPKKVMDGLVGVSWLMDSLVRDSYKKHVFPGDIEPELLNRSRKNLDYGTSYFRIVSDAIDLVVDKSINNLGSETAATLISTLASILKYSLLSGTPEAQNLIDRHRRQQPDILDSFRPEAISIEWRMRVYCKLVRSRQMQLRVTAAAALCEDLVCQWRTYIDRHESGEDNPYIVYLRYLSNYLVDTEIVDYLLGPTCHPEITQASFNIVGFLAVTKTYKPAQTDLLWQTLTSTQDPRISDAIVRMMSKVVGLLDLESLGYMCEKYSALPIESFSSCMREFFDHVTKQMLEKMSPYNCIPLSPYSICVRLVQESSIYGPQGSVLYPEVYHFAMSKFSSLLMGGPDDEGRQIIWMNCVQDIAARSRSTTGSLQVLYTLMSNPQGLLMLISQHNLTQLLVDELETTIANAKAVGFTPVYAHAIGVARRKFWSTIIVNHGSTIDAELGQRLWDLLVGNGAACQDDRKVAWDDLNTALKRTGRGDNPFLKACLREYLPKLPPPCYCGGSLAFVREVIIPLANDINGINLDDDVGLKSVGIELIWQMILTAPSHTIEEAAISTLVDDIYVDSKSIMSYPLHRARRVHFALVQRCLQQLKSAAQSLTSFGESVPSDDSQSLDADSQRELEELQFTRSLQVLIALLKALQTRVHFAAPDLRSLMLQAPSPVDGDLADLKYQSFNGDDQTDIRPLNIGLKNTAASLLASLREATGFDNYRLYYRGQPLAPSETDICRSIGDLDIKNGLILVRRESGIGNTPKRIKPGASPLDIEILSHFKDLWEYLSMEEKLAREVSFP